MHVEVRLEGLQPVDSALVINKWLLKHFGGCWMGDRRKMVAELVKELDNAESLRGTSRSKR